MPGPQATNLPLLASPRVTVCRLRHSGMFSPQHSPSDRPRWRSPGAVCPQIIPSSTLPHAPPLILMGYRGPPPWGVSAQCCMTCAGHWVTHEATKSISRRRSTTESPSIACRGGAGNPGAKNTSWRCGVNVCLYRGVRCTVSKNRLSRCSARRYIEVLTGLSPVR